ncbi:MAG TPA: zf-HC2 domain-containing protein [Candidatus Binatia bacterium]|nr:zf-HC2 domain-containing protein [Candidatus Binatia bacterium]
MKNRKEALDKACREFEADLVLYYYGDCPDAERSRVEAHVSTCDRCERFLEDLRRLLPQMAQPMEFPQTFWDRYYSEMVEKLTIQRERTPWWQSLFAPVRAWAVPAFGTAVVVVLGVTLALTNAKWDFLGRANQDTIPQEILVDASKLDFFKSLDLIEHLRDLEALDGAKGEPQGHQRTSNRIFESVQKRTHHV